jgi:hypothetical protein
MAKKKNKNQSSLEKDKFSKILNDSSDELPFFYIESFEIVYKDSYGYCHIKWLIVRL